MRSDRAGRRRLTRREFGRLVSTGTALPALGSVYWQVT
jgi:hypothetical protein